MRYHSKKPIKNSLKESDIPSICFKQNIASRDFTLFSKQTSLIKIGDTFITPANGDWL